MSSPNDGSPSGGTATDPSGPGADGAGTAAPQKPAGKRGLKRSTRVALLVILVLALLAAGVFAASYFLDARNYVSTDNAQVDGDKIAVNAPASGTLIDWRANQGAELTEDQVVGRIKVNGGFVQPQQSIRAPADGTVVVDNGVEGAFVTAGTQLAIAYDFSKVYVTAGWTRPTSTRSTSGSGWTSRSTPFPTTTSTALSGRSRAARRGCSRCSRSRTRRGRSRR